MGAESLPRGRPERVKLHRANALGKQFACQLRRPFPHLAIVVERTLRTTQSPRLRHMKLLPRCPRRRHTFSGPGTGVVNRNRLPRTPAEELPDGNTIEFAAQIPE